MKTIIVIPARYGSTRLPGKPLADILGKPMIQHVYERALKVPNVEMVVAATDDQRVVDAVEGFGADNDAELFSDFLCDGDQHGDQHDLQAGRRQGGVHGGAPIVKGVAGVQSK